MIVPYYQQNVFLSLLIYFVFIKMDLIKYTLVGENTSVMHSSISVSDIDLGLFEFYNDL